MPTKAKIKPKAPKIRVEEVSDPVEESSEEVEEVKHEPMPEAKVPPKVASFSQLDSDKMSVKDEPDKEPVSKEEYLDEKPVDLTESEPVEEKEEVKSNVPEDNPKQDASSTDIKEWLKDVRPDTTKDVEKSGGGFNGKLFFTLLLVFALLGALAGGVFYYREKVGSVTSDQNTTEEEPETKTESPTPTMAEAKVSDYSVSILNGSGTPGEAGRVKDLLVKAEFSSDKITTGNADKYTYTSTVVSIKSKLPSKVAESVKTALGEAYTVEVSTENLKDESASDIEVIVGKKK